MSHPYDSDARRKARVDFAHRKALLELQRVTLRYQVHNELAVLAKSARLELLARAGLVVMLFVLGACGGGTFSAGEAVELDAGAVDAGDVIEAAAVDAQAFEAEDAFRSVDAGAIALPDVATNDELELDAGDAAAVDAEQLDAGDVDARACVVITGYTCAVSGYPYPARCDTLPCCCATP